MNPVSRTCKDVTAMIIAREDQRLPLVERLAVRLHMSVCNTCPIFERQILTMRNQLQRWRNYADND